MLGVWGNEGTDKWYSDSFWHNENAIKLTLVVDAQFYEYIKVFEWYTLSR